MPFSIPTQIGKILLETNIVPIVQHVCTYTRVLWVFHGRTLVNMAHMKTNQCQYAYTWHVTYHDVEAFQIQKKGTITMQTNILRVIFYTPCCCFFFIIWFILLLTHFAQAEGLHGNNRSTLIHIGLGSNVNSILVVKVRTTKIAPCGNIHSEYHALFRVNKA